MRPRPRDFIGAAVLTLVLFALVAIVFFTTLANADPDALHGALLVRPTVA